MKTGMGVVNAGQGRECRAACEGSTTFVTVSEGCDVGCMAPEEHCLCCSPALHSSSSTAAPANSPMLLLCQQVQHLLTERALKRFTEQAESEQGATNAGMADLSTEFARIKVTQADARSAVTNTCHVVLRVHAAALPLLGASAQAATGDLAVLI